MKQHGTIWLEDSDRTTRPSTAQWSSQNAPSGTSRRIFRGRGCPGRVTLLLAMLLLLAASGCQIKLTREARFLGIGINDFANVNDLDYCVADATALANLFWAQGYTHPATPWHRPRTLLDAQATKEGIRLAIAELAQGASPDTLIVMSFSGHGMRIGTESYIIPHDANLLDDDWHYDVDTWVSTAELASWLAETGLRNIVVIIDACYAGGFADEAGSVDRSPPAASADPIPGLPVFSATHFAELLAANAAASGEVAPIVMAAAGAEELAWEEPLLGDGHGIFTRFLLDTPYAGDRDGDGLVTATEAFAYVLSRVKAGEAWDPEHSVPAFLPHMSGGYRDLVLFGWL